MKKRLCRGLCNRRRPLSAFVGNRRVCKRCKAEKDDNARMIRVYGISREIYDRLLAIQGGRCYICRTPDNRQGRRLCIDHDHKTGKVRGLLCDYCNTAIGLLKDSKRSLSRAIAYLGDTPMERISER